MATETAGILLIVDDEPAVRRSLGRLLRNEGYEVRLASDAESASRILESDSIDVILSDQDMPGRTGIEFLMEAAEKYPHQRRLMISGRFQSEEVAIAMDAGAIHKFMMKPWDDAILKANIRASFRQIMADYKNNNPANDPYPRVVESSEAVETTTSWAGFDEDRRLVRELHAAAGNGSLTLQYQPQIDLNGGQVLGLEALLRWQSSVGPISPDRFITLAERSGAITKLTHWVVCEVFHRVRKWLPDWSAACVGLNVSPVDLRDRQIVDYIEALLGQHDVPAAVVQVEVTESHALNQSANSLAMLRRLADLGVGLAIDDFGAGATSLSYLHDLPFNALKFDRSMTQGISTRRGRAVVAKTIEMARCLGMKVVLEGIENEEQANLARDLGADIGQGFYFSRPVDSGTIQDWVKSGQPEFPE